MKITLTSAQYSHLSLNATAGASKRLTAACTPGDGDSIILTVGAEVLAVLQAVNPADLADAATRVRWKTLPGGALHCSPMEKAPQEPQEAAQEPVNVAATPKRRTKGQAVLELLQRPQGATNAEMMEATGWQTHSVRGFLAGKQLKGMGFRAVGIVREDETRAYAAEALTVAEGDQA